MAAKQERMQEPENSCTVIVEPVYSNSVTSEGLCKLHMMWFRSSKTTVRIEKKLKSGQCLIYNVWLLVNCLYLCVSFYS